MVEERFVYGFWRVSLVRVVAWRCFRVRECWEGFVGWFGVLFFLEGALGSAGFF